MDKLKMLTEMLTKVKEGLTGVNPWIMGVILVSMVVLGFYTL